MGAGLRLALRQAAVIFGDVARPKPMTVQWTNYARSLTARPDEGYAHGANHHSAMVVCAERYSPAADRLADCPRPRDEVRDLEAAGIRIIQVDEPALREGLPLRRADWPAYLDWAVKASSSPQRSFGWDTDSHAHVLLRVRGYSAFNRSARRRRHLDGIGPLANGIA